jgi:hypothetical protein
LAGLLLGRRCNGLKAAAPAAVVALLGGLALVCGLPAWVGEPLLAMAGFAGGLSLLGRPRVWAFAGRRTLHSAALLLACGAVLGGQLLRLDAQADTSLPDDPGANFTQPAELDGPPSCLARTDAGCEIPLFSVSAADGVSAETEAHFIQGQRLGRKLIQTGPADVGYNCHGWVFTGGRYWVRGGCVDAILAENGYQPTAAPLPGDVAVFRDATGAVTHTGVVRGTAEGAVLIESKWGAMGRYIHTADDHAYRAHKVSYYHSGRGGHLLRGLQQTPARHTGA